MAVPRRGTWAVLDPRAGSVTVSDRHSWWQMDQGDCLQVRGQSLDTPLDRRRCETRQGLLEEGANFFTAERDREHITKGGR